MLFKRQPGGRKSYWYVTISVLIDDLSEKNKAAALVLVSRLTTNVHVPSLLDFI